MKRTVSLFFIFALVAASLLSGCTRDGKLVKPASLSDLSDSKRIEILMDLDTFRQSSISYVDYWENFWRDDANGLNQGIEYYGTYNDTIVLLFPVEAWDGETTNVAGLKFYCYELQLLAYKDHTFYYLDHAYATGLLSKEDIIRIHENHMFYRNW